MDATGSSAATVMIRLSGVGKRFDDGTVAVHDLDLEVLAGEMVVLVGPSGCGKSTTLKMINRLVEPSSGTIEIDGQDVTTADPVRLRRGIGYVIQQIGLFPHQRIVTNVMTVPLLYGESKAHARSRAVELLELVGLDPERYADRFPHQLSGGQRQRVGVARALAADPPVLLMDEPFGAVDPITRQRLQDELLSIQRELGKTVVMVTHDIDEAVKMGDRVAVFAEGGRLAQYGTPAELLGEPADEFVEDFVGSGSSLKQLSLVRVSEVELHRPVTATVGEKVGDVRRRAEAAGERSVVVLDSRGRPVSWPWLRQLKGDSVVEPADELITIDQRATLNVALDTMLSSSHGGAVVTGDRDQYLGVVVFDAVTDHIRSLEEQADE